VTTAVTRVCAVCGVDKLIRAFRVNSGGYRARVCRLCHLAAERADYATIRSTSRAVPKGARACRVCGILLRVGGRADNDSADAVAHGHEATCCVCSGDVPLVDLGRLDDGAAWEGAMTELPYRTWRAG